jgi:hypothetical protein
MSAPAAKRQRTNSAPTRLVPTDPLKKVPKTLAEVTTRVGFTVCDLVVVLKLMSDLFDVSFRFCGPHEGSIQLMEKSGPPFDREAWITKKDVAKGGGGFHTELRLSGQHDSEGEALRCLQKVFQSFELASRRNQDTVLKITDSHADVVEKIVALLPDGFSYKKKYTNEDVRRILCLPMPLLLRECFPNYTWPRWLFGAFEGLVMRRVEVAHAGQVAELE